MYVLACSALPFHLYHAVARVLILPYVALPADRYRNAQGHMEDAPPPLNETPIADIRPRR